MINIFNDLNDLNKKVYAEGDAPKELPNDFYTVSEDYTSDNLNADNKTFEVLYEFTLKYYTKDAETLYTGLNKAITSLKSKGYIIDGVGNKSQSYKDYYAREVDVKKIDYIS